MSHSIFNVGTSCNPGIAASFSGGDITTNAGIALFGSFMESSGIDAEMARIWGGRMVGKGRTWYRTADLVRQRTWQTVAGYTTQDASDELRRDPAFLEVLGGACASQPTMSRFFTSATEADVAAMRDCSRAALRLACAARKPERVTLDIDTTLVPTFGAQEDAGFNGHYQAVGYHPVLVYDSGTGDVLAGELRPGGQYCSKGAGEFLERTLRELVEDLRAAGVEDVSVRLRADSGFAAPEVYKALEEMDVRYAIRLKDNAALGRKAWPLVSEVSSDPDWSRDIERYGESTYKAGSWDHERRVVFLVARRKGCLAPDVQCVVTTMEEPPEEVFAWYRGRGGAENDIKETKESFLRSLPHRDFICNSFLFQFELFCHLVFSLFRGTCLGPSLARARVSAIQSRLFRIGARVSRSGRRVHFRMSSAWPHRKEYEEAWEGIARTWPPAERRSTA